MRSVKRGICPIHVHNERTVPIIMAGCIEHARNGHISTSGLKSDVTIVYLVLDFPDTMNRSGRGSAKNSTMEELSGWFQTRLERRAAGGLTDIRSDARSCISSRLFYVASRTQRLYRELRSSFAGVATRLYNPVADFVRYLPQTNCTSTGIRRPATTTMN